MKFLRLFFFCVCIALFSSLSAQEILNKSFMHDGILREYRLALPSNFEARQPLPFIVNMHGLGSNSLEQLLYSAMTELADSLGFILAYPQGLEATIGPQTSTHWNAGFGTGVDDLGFVGKLIDQTYLDYGIDLSRVYATGMSNGGFMSYHLACQLSDRIAAIASVTGAMTFGDIGNCAVDRPVPVMQIHGTADGTVPFGGTPFFNPPISEGVQFWVTRNGCSAVADTTVIADVDLTDESTANLYVYGDCDDNTAVHFYVVDNGGHSWPGAFPIPGLSPTNQDFSATEVMLEFFGQHVHPDPAPVSALATDDPLEFAISFPNPFSQVLPIQVKDQGLTGLQIMDIQGRLLWQEEHIAPLSIVTVPTADWDAGFYMLRIWTPDGIHVDKLVKY